VAVVLWQMGLAQTEAELVIRHGAPASCIAYVCVGKSCPLPPGLRLSFSRSEHHCDDNLREVGATFCGAAAKQPPRAHARLQRSPTPELPEFNINALYGNSFLALDCIYVMY